jgi:hypothetical protein
MHNGTVYLDGATDNVEHATHGLHATSLAAAGTDNFNDGTPVMKVSGGANVYAMCFSNNGSGKLTVGTSSCRSCNVQQKKQRGCNVHQKTTKMQRVRHVLFQQRPRQAEGRYEIIERPIRPFYPFVSRSTRQYSTVLDSARQYRY